MLRFGHPAFSARVLVLASAAFLSGCGFMMPEPREPWRGQAEAACMRSGIVKESQWVRAAKPIDGPGPCGADIPLKVAAFENDMTALAPSAAPSAYAAMGLPKLPASEPISLKLTVLKPEATLTCPMVAWLDDWMANAVQPAATAWFNQPVKEIRTGGSYACRRRNHQSNARLSEHAFGNAIDVMSFVMADGNVITVKGGWRGTEQEQGFLRDVFHSGCQRFRTALGPGSDAFHYDHFHFDLARHDAAGQRRYCKPQVAAPQRPVPGAFPGPLQMPEPAGAMLSRPLASSRPLPTPTPPQSAFGGQNGNEIEPDFDPREFDLTSAIPDLPRPRRRASDTESKPASSFFSFPRSTRSAPKMQMGYDPAGK